MMGEMRVVCVTGMSDDPSPAAKATLRRLLEGADRVVHGVCVGADEAAHEIAVDLGVPEIVGYPGHDGKGESPKRFVVWPFPPGYSEWAPEPYLRRNRAMVRVSTEVAAVVKSASYYRSGEWATVRYAKRVGRPVALVLPDGSTV